MGTLFDELTPDELHDVKCRIGSMMLKLPVTAKMLGHKMPAYPISGNYLVPSGQTGSVERIVTEFVNDLFTASTQEICEKWYGASDANERRRQANLLGPEGDTARRDIKRLTVEVGLANRAKTKKQRESTSAWLRSNAGKPGTKSCPVCGPGVHIAMLWCPLCGGTNGFIEVVPRDRKRERGEDLFRMLFADQYAMKVMRKNADKSGTKSCDDCGPGVPIELTICPACSGDRFSDELA
jgi:hypothetical protein